MLALIYQHQPDPSWDLHQSAGELRDLWDDGDEVWWSALSLFANLWHPTGEFLGIDDGRCLIFGSIGREIYRNISTKNGDVWFCGVIFSANPICKDPVRDGMMVYNNPPISGKGDGLWLWVYHINHLHGTIVNCRIGWSEWAWSNNWDLMSTPEEESPAWGNSWQ